MQRDLDFIWTTFSRSWRAAPLIGHLLERCRPLRVPVTSWATLRLYGEYEYAVPPLAVPDPQHVPPLEHVSQYAALRLFCERAQAVDAGFALTEATGSSSLRWQQRSFTHPSLDFAAIGGQPRPRERAPRSHTTLTQ